MSKTFYIAGSSDQRELIAEYADDLMVSGWGWAWDWTRVREEALKDNGNNGGMFNAAIKLARPGLVMTDLHAAMTCDVFVFFPDPAHPSLGGAAEFGARLATGKTAHVVAQYDNHHLFYEHPGVIEHENWADLLKHLGLRDLP